MLLKKKKKERNSHNFTNSQVQQFFDLYLLIHRVEMTSVRDYLKNSKQVSDIADIVLQNQFATLLHHFYFTNNLNSLIEVRSMGTYPSRNFFKISAEEIQSIDEIMIAFKGTSS